MASTEKAPAKRRMWLIDPVYRRFTKQAFRSMTSGEFYEFFTTMLKNGEHQFQFSNRKLDMRVDESWVNIIEDTIPAFIEITRNPRVIITQEELITNVIQAKRIDAQVVRHLCAHSYLVDAIDENGEIRPGKVLNLLKEESWDTYENRFVYTLIKKTFDFVRKRYMDMQEAMNDEFGATLLIDSTANSALETMSVKTEMKIRQIDDLFDTQDKQKNIFARIQYIYEMMNQLMQTRFAKEMSKYAKVDPPLVPTNAIKKNPYLRKCHKLWNFLLSYYNLGFTIEIIEQNPEINEKFEQDIFHNIMFTYIILKGYLEDNRDRALDRNVRAQRRILRPRYIKEIVEDIVQDFNMSDVEVRKILIEELTKEQLMREERSERYQLVEARRKAEEERKRQAEMERLRRLKEKEKEAKRLAREKQQEQLRKERERAREEVRRLKEKERQEQQDQKLTELLSGELTAQLAEVEKRRGRQAAKPHAKAKEPAVPKRARKRTIRKSTDAVGPTPAQPRAESPASPADTKTAALQVPAELEIPLVPEVSVAQTERGEAMPPAVADDPVAEIGIANETTSDRSHDLMQRLSKLIRGRR